MSTELWIICSIVVLISAIIMGITGFGFALIVIPLFLLLMEAKYAVIYNIFLGTIICIPIMWLSRKSLKLGKIALLVVSCILGLPVGIYVLTNVSSPTLKLVIAASVIIFAIILSRGISYKFKREWLGCIISGFLGGIFMTSIGLGGIPVILFLINQNWEKEVFRANLNAFFILTGIAAFVAIGAVGTVTKVFIINASILVIPLLLGLFIGVKLIQHINSIWLKRISTYVLVVAGVLGILDALTVLL